MEEIEEVKTGRCCSRRTYKDIEEKRKQFDFFVSVSQFDANLREPPKTLADLKKWERLPDFKICFGSVTYGVRTNGEIEWLGDEIDSSD